MGCWSGKESEVHRPRENGNNGRTHRNNGRPQVQRENRVDPNSAYCGTIDKIENVIPDSYVGEGIKRTHAYTTDLTEEQYKKWKEQFWETRCEGSEAVWEVLRKACELDHIDSAELIEKHGITLHAGKLTFWYDEKGMSYAVPPACINEPVDFGKDKEKERFDAIDKPTEIKTLNLVLRNASTFEDDTIQIEDSSSVVDLKKQYAEEKNCGSGNKVRILYFGRELKDEYNLWHYGINDDIILIAVVNQELDDE